MTSAVRFGIVFALCSLATVAGCGGPSTTSDGGSPAEDSATDVGPTCSGDLECNDGLFCNGEERCVASHCTAGAPPACDDGASCTRDYCSEDRRACIHQVPDVDGDGHGDASCHDGSGTALGDDCLDTDADAFPGNAERCDTAHHDEDCDPSTHGYIDGDSDGFEDAACCNGSLCGTDCDDSNRSVNTAASEVCNRIDDDCNGTVDEGVGVMLYPDADRDGFGDSSGTQANRCGDTVGFAARGGDCDDTRVDRNPGQLEICDSIDNDCDETIDESTGAVTWYPDTDGDGYGDAQGTTLVQCMPPDHYSLLGTDCDDTTTSRSPRVAEVCNGIDDDCNGLADYDLGMGNLEDDDRDGVADQACGLPRGLDCNDRDSVARPGATELCNGRDDDCDTRVDESSTSETFHRDADGDGYGDPGTAVIGCFAPTGYVRDARDCDDTNGGRSPSASETCNALDDDCDRRLDEGPAASSCSIPNGVAACTVGVCHLASCQDGFSDCNTTAGCETPTGADDARCGACDSICEGFGEQCVSSTCVPGGSYGIAGGSRMDDMGTAVAYRPMDGTLVIGGTFAGRGFGVGCGSSLDAQGIAAVISRRNLDRCSHVLAIDGSGDEIVTGIELDTSGNALVVLTTTSATLSVGSIAVNAASGQGMRDVVVALLDASLVPQWAHRYGGPSDDVAGELAVGGTEAWIATGIRGPATIGTGTLPATGTTDPLMIALNATDGTFLRFVNANTSGADFAHGVALDATHVYVVGTLVGSGMFGTTPLAATGPADGFAWAFDRATNTTTAARAMGGSGFDSLTAIVDGAGAGPLVAVGLFDGTLDGLTSAGSSDGVVIALDTALTTQWSRQMGGSGSDALLDVAYVGMNVVAVGTFAGSATTTGATDAAVSAGGTDAIAVTFGPTGFLFGQEPLGGTGNDAAFAIGGAPGQGIGWVAGSYGATWTASGSTTFEALGGLDAFWAQIYAAGS